ncbi:MAG: hypothetical protein ACFFD2_06415 [Promethearchaeota archaeon]
MTICRECKGAWNGLNGGPKVWLFLPAYVRLLHLKMVGRFDKTCGVPEPILIEIIGAQETAEFLKRLGSA